MRNLLFIRNRNSYEKIMPGQGDYKTMSGDNFRQGNQRKYTIQNTIRKVKKLSINTEGFISSKVLHVALSAKICKICMQVQYVDPAGYGCGPEYPESGTIRIQIRVLLQKFAKFLRRTFQPAWSRIPLTNLIQIRAIHCTLSWYF